MSQSDLYAQDFYAWTQAQAALLEARQFEALDLVSVPCPWSIVQMLDDDFWPTTES